jgi:hypothetical protein
MARFPTNSCTLPEVSILYTVVSAMLANFIKMNVWSCHVDCWIACFLLLSSLGFSSGQTFHLISCCVCHNHGAVQHPVPAMCLLLIVAPCFCILLSLSPPPPLLRTNLHRAACKLSTLTDVYRVTCLQVNGHVKIILLTKSSFRG